MTVQRKTAMSSSHSLNRFETQQCSCPVIPLQHADFSSKRLAENPATGEFVKSFGNLTQAVNDAPAVYHCKT